MNKGLNLILISACALSMTACGTTGAGEGAASNTASASIERSESAASEASAEASEETSASAENIESSTGNNLDFYRNSNGGPVYLNSSKYYYENSDDGKSKLLFEGKSESLLIIDEDKEKYPKLSDYLTRLHDKEIADMDKISEEFTEQAKIDYKDDLLIGNYSEDRSCEISRADSNILSFVISYSNYTNGAHGTYGIYPYNVNVESGEDIALNDVINIDNDKFKEILKSKLEETAKADGLSSEEAFFDLDESLSHYEYEVDESRQDPDDTENYKVEYTWYLDKQGLHVYFEIYSIAAYAYGDSNVLIGYDEMPEIFNPEYIPKSENIGSIQAYNGFYDTKIDIDNDGKDENLTIDYEFANTGDEYDYIKSLTLKVDDKSATFNDIYLDISNAYTKYYLVKTADNRSYIYISSPEANDYYNLYVFDINNGDVKTVTEEDGYPYVFSLAYVQNSNSDESGEICLIDPENIYLGERFDLFGTFTGIGRYHVGPDGLPELNADHYELSWTSNETVSSKEDMTLDIVDEDGNILSEGETIKSGETFVPQIVRIIEDKNVLDAKISDGRIVRLNYSSTEYPIEINGKSIDDLFDGLMYAG
ncbi:DUF3298 domain-containing protein [Lachnospiraceae bacterium C1.1]|nr:DUF3298 domain-containing protein [Lachnospiraceae bacterium C1.1]